MKKYLIIIPLLTVLAAAAVVFAVMSKSNTDKPEQTTTPYKLSQSVYTGMLSEKGTLDFPLLQTDIDNLFYLANPNGSVVFYGYTPEGLVPYTGKVSTLKTEVTCSHQDIPVTLTFVKQGNKITGYGLFSTEISKAPVKIYAYAFFKITSLPAAYSKSGVLLLVDFDKANFYINEKLYTEAFILTLGNGNTKRLITDNSRTIDTIGAFRSDWVLFYEDFLESLGSKALFLSSRDYNLDQKGLVSEILAISSPKPPRIVKGLLGLWARVTKEGVVYLRKTNDGFKSVLFANSKEAVIKEFSGDYFKDYIYSGKYVLNKSTLILTDLFTGKEKSLNSFTVSANSLLSISPKGTWAVIASTDGIGVKASQTLVLYNLSTGIGKTVTEPLMFLQSGANFCWIDNNTLLHLRPSSDKGTGLSYCILKMS
ncbi:MAG: hypothetical protein WCN92_00235 [Eubacteriales bacterium]